MKLHQRTLILVYLQKTQILYCACIVNQRHYQQQKHNEAQNTQVLLNDPSFTVPRKVTKKKMNYVSSPMKINRFELLSCDTNENENLDL